MRIHHRDLCGHSGPGGGAISAHRVLERDGGDHDPEGDSGVRSFGRENIRGRLGGVRGQEGRRGRL